MNPKTSQHKPTNQIVTYLLLTILLSGLLVYGAKGIYSRYAQDDYCYGYHVRTLGFIDTQLSSYWQQNEYNGNRYSATLSHSIIEVMGGVNLSPTIPGLLVVSWGIGLYLVAAQLIPKSDQQNQIMIRLLITCFVLFYSFYLAPNLYEILYWNPGQQAYLMPMVIYTFITALLLWFAQLKKLNAVHYLVISFLCFYAGGFSETPTTWFLVVMIIAAILLQLFKNYPFNRISGRQLLLCAIASTILAVLFLGLSPSNGTRLSDENRSSLFEIVKMVLIYGVDFLINTIRSAPIPYIILITFGFFASGFVKRGKLHSPPYYLKFIFCGIIILYALSATTMFPTMVATSTYPGYRALTPIQFSLVLYCVLFGWWVERIVSFLVPVINKKRINLLISSLIGILLAVYSARAVTFVLRDLDLYKERARGWDQREAMIINARECGETNLKVPALDSVYGITELTADAGNWVNICAAKYYGVNSITAIENYEGMGTFPIGK